MRGTRGSTRSRLRTAPWDRNELWRRAQAIPSLDQRFAEDKSLVDRISGQNLITFTRVSSATTINAAGAVETVAAGLPRFTHDPVTGESLGLLVEEQRTNLATYSEQFDNAAWTKYLSLVAVDANQATSPDGTNSADTLRFASASTNVFVLFNKSPFTVTSGATYTASIFVKAIAGGVGFAAIAANINGDYRYSLCLNLSDGTVSNLGSSTTAADYSVAPVGNGWWRVSIKGTPSVTTAYIEVWPRLTAGAPSNYITVASGDVGKGLYIWGAQLEAGDFPTSYIPTTTAAVTRAASLADLINSAIVNNIRSFYVEFRSPAVGTRGVVSLNDNTANERASLLTSGTDPKLVVVDGGVTQADIDGGTVSANAVTRVAVRLGANDFAICVNGGAVVTDSSGTLPTVDRIMLGRTQAGEYLNSRIARFSGWQQSLPDSILQSLTS